MVCIKFCTTWMCMFPQTRWTKPIYDAAPTKSPVTFVVQSLNTEWYIVFMWCIYKMASQPLQIYFIKRFPEVIHGFLHHYQCSSSVWSSRLWPKLTDPHPTPETPIFNPWETFFLPQQIKGGWVRRQGPDQLSEAAISTVLSFWHTSKIWALSKAKEAISQQGKLFTSISLYWYLSLHISFL